MLAIAPHCLFLAAHTARNAAAAPSFLDSSCAAELQLTDDGELLFQCFDIGILPCCLSCHVNTTRTLSSRYRGHLPGLVNKLVAF